MASGRGGNNTNRNQKENDDKGGENVGNNCNGISDDDQQTLDLVEQFKIILQKNVKVDELITEDDVELATFDARCKLDRDIKKWENDPSINLGKSSTELLHQSIAYARTREQIDSILQAKQKQIDKNPNEYPKKKRSHTSLEDVIGPLRKLKGKMPRKGPENLFAAVLQIDQDKINYADRMFYVEARRFFDDPTDYTFERAHDQVQAIRLMHYETNSEEKLRTFIQKCTNFDRAYAHLQELARDRVTGRSNSASPSGPAPPFNTKRSESSLVQKEGNEGKTKVNSSSSSSASSELFNSAQNSDSLDRRTTKDNKLQRSEDDQDDGNSPGKGKNRYSLTRNNNKK